MCALIFIAGIYLSPCDVVRVRHDFCNPETMECENGGFSRCEVEYASGQKYAPNVEDGASCHSFAKMANR